jgi:hypothetical protein
MQRDSSTEQSDFLKALAAGIPEGSYFHIAEKTPSTFHNSVWHEQHLDGPWYFFTGASTDRKHRRRGDLVAVRAIILDDVDANGVTTKPREGVPQPTAIEPTWKLETSPGNYQWGYLLKTWDADIPKADALMQALVDAGYQDKGVNTSCRLFRLPGSLNTKPGRTFEALLHSFDIDRTFTLNSIAKGFGVRPGKPKEMKVDSGDRPGAGKPDRLFDWLQERGVVRHEASGGWWEIDCPFPEEHTDERTEAKYLPSFASEDGEPGVMCFHGHGVDKPAEYRKRFFAWATAQGAPTGKTDWAELRKMFAAIRTEPPEVPPPRVERVNDEGEPSDEYTFQTLTKAIGTIRQSELPDIEKTEKGKPKKSQACTIDNIEAGLAQLGIVPRFNLMKASTSYTLPDRIEMRRFGSKTRYEIDEMMRLSIRAAFSRAGISNKNDVDGCIAGLAASRYWHPAKDWIESKPWDGQDRLEHLVKSVSTADPSLFATYFRRWALQCVEAACGWAVSAERRESQKSLCLVLAGKQGIGKSRWLASLAPGYFAGGKHLSLDSSVSGSRDSKHEVLQGMIVELGELDTTFTKSANGSLKAFLSMTTDVYRLPYAETPIQRPRCTSFAATVNDDQFLQDDTGSRRYAVIWADNCDVDHMTDMQQFWAQIHAAWKGGEQWWLTPAEEKLQAKANEDFQAADGIADLIQLHIEKRTDSDTYPMECSLNATGVLMLLGLKAEDRALRRRAKAACIKLISNPVDYRKRGGSAESWAFFLDSREAKELGVKVLKPR